MSVAVVGAGIVGLATAYALQQRGEAVTVYEAAAPGRGQSGGDGRVFRHAHDDPRLVVMARESRALWRRWGEELGVELVSPDGAVALGPAVEDRLRLLSASGVSARALDAAELAEIMPMLAPYEGPAMLDEHGGAIRTTAAVAALSGALGDALVAGEVFAVRPSGAGAVELLVSGQRREHSAAVVCAGRETARLARQVGISLPVRLAAHVRLSFRTRGPAPSRLPCLQDGSGEFGEVGVYAAPHAGGEGYGLGLSRTTPARADGALLSSAELASLGQRAASYVERALPGLDPAPTGHLHCWVTDLPWSEDGVAVWEAGGVSFVAGHNLFKQAPALGVALARAAVGEGLPQELRPEARLGEAEA